MQKKAVFKWNFVLNIVQYHDSVSLDYGDDQFIEDKEHWQSKNPKQSLRFCAADNKSLELVYNDRTEESAQERMRKETMTPIHVGGKGWTWNARPEQRSLSWTGKGAST
jgi:hypothetical protein